MLFLCDYADITTPEWCYHALQMSDLEQWLKLYKSENPVVRFRAAEGLLKRGDEVPLAVLLNIFDEFCNEGLGRSIEKVLSRRRDKELASEMISRLSSPDHSIREIVCEVLKSLEDRAATKPLLSLLKNDRYLMVRRAAAFALASLKDPASVSELKRQYELQKNDLNMELAIGCALEELGQRR